VNDVDFELITQVQKNVWSLGDFAKIGELTMIVGEELCEAVDVFPGERVLDVACGQGNASVAAARRTWNTVIGLDYVPALLERARERAASEHLDIEYIEGDAQNLPFEDASFDVVLSTFGAMFAPDQSRTAQEILRVTRPGGRIGMANWTPDGYVGGMFSTATKHAPVPPGVPSPTDWGTEAGLRALFGDGVSELRLDPDVYTFRFPSFEAWLGYFREWFGPIQMAFARVGEEGVPALEADLRQNFERFDRGEGRAMVVPAEYSRVVAVRA
jgi:SAM-dependent methyltransferase